jgi:hypothetical protein
VHPTPSHRWSAIENIGKRYRLVFSMQNEGKSKVA